MIMGSERRGSFLIRNAKFHDLNVRTLIRSSSSSARFVNIRKIVRSDTLYTRTRTWDADRTCVCVYDRYAYLARIGSFVKYMCEGLKHHALAWMYTRGARVITRMRWYRETGLEDVRVLYPPRYLYPSAFGTRVIKRPRDLFPRALRRERRVRRSCTTLRI